MPIDVFISYTRSDHAITSSLAASLEAEGLRIWWDSHLSPGDDIDLVIHQVLSDTRVVVAVLSPTSISSDWVMWELSQARRSGLSTVLVLVEGVRVQDLPSTVRSMQSVVLQADRIGPSLVEVASQVRDTVERARLRPAVRDGACGENYEGDARRRLAIAATEVARDGPAPKPGRTKGPPGHRIRAEVRPTDYSASAGLFDFLDRHDISIAFTSPRSGALHLVGRGSDGTLTVHEQDFRKTMGLHRTGNALLMVGLDHIYRLESLDGDGDRAGGTFSHCFVPTVSYFTTSVDAHDVAVTGRDRVIFANSRYNCVAEVSGTAGFEAVWTPPFISEVIAQDRCHLNGLALCDGEPAYVTAAAESNTADGWRSLRSEGGVVIDVRANRVVTGGLSMPHSPRVDGGRLWLLNSGRGELGFVEGADGHDARFVPTAFCHGYTRGLAIHGGYAFVGVSHPRHRDFSGFDLERGLLEAGAEPWCGIRIVDTATGECVEWLRIDRRVGEIYDVAVLPHVRCPRSMGPMRDEESTRGLSRITDSEGQHE